MSAEPDGETDTLVGHLRLTPVLTVRVQDGTGPKAVVRDTPAPDETLGLHILRPDDTGVKSMYLDVVVSRDE